MKAQAFPRGAQRWQFLSAMCFGSEAGGALCFWCLGTWATLGIGLSRSEIFQPPPPQPAVRRGARRETPVRTPPDEAPTAKQGRGQIGSILESLGGRGAAGESGADGAASRSLQAGRSGDRRQRIPLPRRAMRSSGN